MPPKKDQLPKKHFRIASPDEQQVALADLTIDERVPLSPAARKDEARQSLLADASRELPTGKVKSAPPCP